MALPRGYKGLEPTKLHQQDFLPKYRILKDNYLKQNPELSIQKIHRQIYSELGYPHWDKSGAAGEFGKGEFKPYLMNEGLPRVAGTRQNSNGKASVKRKDLTTEQTLTREDYRDFAKRNGYLEKKADKLYEINEKRLTALKSKKGLFLNKSRLKVNYEHGLPTTSTTYGGVEHYRNLLLMDNKSNGKKSDLMMTPKNAVKAGFPLSKQSALQMDFNGIPATPPKVKREIIKDDLTKNNPLKSRNKNKIWDKLKLKKANKLKIGAGGSNTFNKGLTPNSLADEAFKHLQLDSYHKIRTPFGIMPRA